MIPTDKEQLRISIAQLTYKYSGQGTLKSAIRIARELKNHVGNDFITELENDYRSEFGIDELNKI